MSEDFKEHRFNITQQNERTLKKGYFVFYLFAMGLLVVVDQMVKYLVFSQRWKFLNKNILGFPIVLFKNQQFAFSIPLPTWFMYAIYILILFFVVKYLVFKYYVLNFRERLAWVFILSGAMSNIGERLVFGYVRDFIYFFSGIFNFADIYIILGILLLVFIQPNILISKKQ